LKSLRLFAALFGFANRIYLILGTSFIFLLLSLSSASADDVPPLQTPVLPIDPNTGTALQTPELLSPATYAPLSIDSAEQSVQQAEDILTTSVGLASPYQLSQNNSPITDAQAAIADATSSVAKAKSDIIAVETATALNNSAQVELAAATQSVANAQTHVENATTAVSDAQTTLDNVTAELPVLQTAANTACTNFYVENGNLGTATSDLVTATSSLANAETHLSNETAGLEYRQGVVVMATQVLDNANAMVEYLQEGLTSQKATRDQIQAVVNANTTVGLTETIYKDTGYNNAPPLGAGYIMTVTTDTNGISEQWGNGGPVAGANDDFQVKWEGQITSTVTQNINFYAPADDGVKLYLDNVLVINDWRDKGGGGSVSAPVSFTAGVAKNIIMWFYENGGGANVQLQWNANGYWQTVPATAFGQCNVTPEQLAALEQANQSVNDVAANLATWVENQRIAVNSLAANQGDVAYSLQIVADAQTAKDNAAAAVIEAQTAYDVQLEVRDAAYAEWQSAIQSVNAQATSIADAQTTYELAQVTLKNAIALHSEAEAILIEKQTIAEITAATLTSVYQTAVDNVQLAQTLSDVALSKANIASTAISTTPINAPRPPIDPPFVVDPPVDVPPVEQPPIEQPPVEQPPVEQPPTEEPPVEQPPTEEPPAPVVEPPTPVEEAPPVVTENSTPAEIAAAVEAVIAAADGEAVTAAAIAEAGLTYADLPPATPVEVRTDENGNQVIITAEVAAALQVLESPSELIGAIFSDPGQVLLALGSIGADMSPQEREEAQKMVVATVIAGGAAMNAVGAAASAAGGSTGGGSKGGGSPKGGGTGGGPAAGGDKPKRTVRRRNT
jgi:hypothetical protein